MIRIEKLKKISEKPWFYPAALLLLAFVSYGYVLTSLGFYWADWEVVMFNKLSPSLQFDFFAEDRPFPWTYQLIHFLVGSRPIGWHVVNLLLRWGGTLFFAHALILFWPQYRKQFFWLGALLMVYPGFLQQLQSTAFSRHIMTLLLFAFSLYTMAHAIRRPRQAQLFYLLSWIATFMHLFTIEYFSGFEFMRPVLIWILVADGTTKGSHLLQKVVKISLPYLLITVFFLWARFIYFPTIFQTLSNIGNIGSSMAEFQDSFVGSLLNLFNRSFLDLLHSTLQVWINSIISLDGFTFQQRIAWFSFGLGALFAVIFSFFYNTSEDDDVDCYSPILIVLVGLLFFVMSAFPVWAIGKEISTGGWNGRFSLAPMFGATLLIVGLVLLLVKPAGQKWVFGFLLMFSVATQIWTVNVYRRDWSIQNDYHWQLYWRVPAIKTDTAVLSYEYPSRLVTHDMDATWTINVLYHFQIQDDTIPYMFITPEDDVYFQQNVALKRPARNFTFVGNTSDSIAVLHQTGDSCLRVLDDVYLDDPLLHDGHTRLIPVSNLSRIIPDPALALPDSDIFGPEPEHTWCYFFQKADLARQTEDWGQVLALYAEAQQMGFSPKYGAEYIPFIEAYAQAGDWENAYNLTITAQKMTPQHKRIMCATWTRLGELPAADMEVSERLDQTLSC